MPRDERTEWSLARRTAIEPNVREPVIPEPDLVTEVELSAGLAQLQTWLTEPGGRTHGAYCVAVDRLEHQALLSSAGPGWNGGDRIQLPP